VLPGSILFTDDYSGYRGLGNRGEHVHKRINHSARVYVDGDVHTQTIEGFFGCSRAGYGARITRSRTSGCRAT